MNIRNNRIIFLTQTSDIGASARYRVYQYIRYLEKEGFACTVSPAVPDNILLEANNQPNFMNKFRYYSAIIQKRISDMKKINEFDCIFIQRDILIHVYPIIEKLIALRHRKIIFDFDDALYLFPPHKKMNFLFNLLWDKKKIEKIIKLSGHVIAGNFFLKNYAEDFTRNVTLIPTSIDLGFYNFNEGQKRLIGKKVRIGWIGNQGTFDYLEKIMPVFQKLAKNYDIEIVVIGAKGEQVEGIKITYRDWNPQNEVEEIKNFDIGVMPLTNDEWSEGKSGTKLLQYMAAGIPAVVSPVGVNKEIVEEGLNGFLASSPEEWLEKISNLIERKVDVDKICLRARKTVEEEYSVKVNAVKLKKVIEKVLE